MPPFFRRTGTSVHLRKCQRIWKHQSKIEQYYSSRIRRFWVRTGIQIQHPPGSVLGEKQSRIDQMVLEDFSNNGSYPPRQHVTRDRPCKAGSCLLGACFKLLLLHGFMLFEYMRNSLDGFCQHFLQQIEVRALQLTKRSSERTDYKLNCASYKVYECNLVFVGLCTQDEDIAISWWMFPWKGS